MYGYSCHETYNVSVHEYKLVDQQLKYGPKNYNTCCLISLLNMNYLNSCSYEYEVEEHHIFFRKRDQCRILQLQRILIG